MFDLIQSPQITATYMEYFDSTQRDYGFESSGPARFSQDQEVTFIGPCFPAGYPYEAAVPEPYGRCCENGLPEGVLSRHYGLAPQAIENMHTLVSHGPGSHDASMLREDFSHLMNGPFYAGNGFDSLPVGQDGTRTLDPRRHFIPNSGLSNAILERLNPLTGNESYVIPPALGNESANGGPKPEDWNPRSLDVAHLQVSQDSKEMSVPRHKAVRPKNRKVDHQRASNRAQSRNDAGCIVLQPRRNQELQCKPLRTRRNFTSAEKKQIKWCREVGACSSCRAKKGKVCHGTIKRRKRS